MEKTILARPFRLAQILGQRTPVVVTAATLLLAFDLTAASTAVAAGAGGDSNSPSLPVWIAAVAQAVTALSVIFLFWQIWESRKNAKAERTREFQERYLSDEFAPSVSRTVGCLRTRDAGECIDLIEAWSNRADARKEVLPRPNGGDKASVHDIEKTLGLFEDMGTAYNLKQLDERVVLRSFAIPTVQVFTTAWWLICWQRDGRLAGEEEDGRTESVYVEFEAMCKALRRSNKSLTRHPKLRPVPGVRALCLPKGHGERLEDEDLWRNARRLSLSLSAWIGSAEGTGGVAAGLEELAKGIESFAGPDTADDPREGWEIVLVPEGIDQPCDDDWAHQRGAARQLARSLSRAAESGALDAAVADLESRAPAA